MNSQDNKLRTTSGLAGCVLKKGSDHSVPNPQRHNHPKCHASGQSGLTLFKIHNTGAAAFQSTTPQPSEVSRQWTERSDPF
jgi:hypothetical protein